MIWEASRLDGAALSFDSFLHLEAVVTKRLITKRATAPSPGGVGACKHIRLGGACVSIISDNQREAAARTGTIS